MSWPYETDGDRDEALEAELLAEQDEEDARDDEAERKAASDAARRRADEHSPRCAPSPESVAEKVEAHARVMHEHIRPIIEGPAWDDLPDTTRRWYLDTAWEAAAGERSTNRATYTPQEQEIAREALATRRGKQT